MLEIPFDEFLVVNIIALGYNNAPLNPQKHTMHLNKTLFLSLLDRHEYMNTADPTHFLLFLPLVVVRG